MNFITSMANKMKKLKIIFLIILLAQGAFGTIRYVSKTGSSNPPYLTWETASDSIQKCINICVDGDTLIVANGVYKETLIINTAITLLGSSMDSCVIDGTGLDLLSERTIEVRAQFKIEGFTIWSPNSQAGYKCIHINYVNANLSEVINCRLLNGVLESSFNTNLKAKNLIVQRNKGYGIFTYGENLVVENCVILMDSDSDIKKGILSNSRNVRITNNILISEQPGNNYSQGRGIELESMKMAYISNNIIANFWGNIKVYRISPGDSGEISNNLSCYNYYDGSLTGITTWNSFKTYNNILYKVDAGINGHGEDIPGGNNLFWGNKIDASNGYVIKETDIIADPMFVKDTMPTSSLGFDFHLQAFSPAIDAGDPTVLDVDGTRSDIGPYGGPYGEEYTYQDLAPRKPYGIVPAINEREVTIKWRKNSEADTSHYVVYRDTVSNFPIDSLHVYRTQKDTLFQDIIQQTTTRIYYRIQAADKQGNKSDASEEIVFVLSDAGDYKTDGAFDYHLYQNYPNPFNPGTVIGYQLAADSYVKIMVYDIKGELLEVLVNEHKPAGYNEVEFNGSKYASGIYLCRIEVIDDSGIPRFMNMRKMVLIK